MKLIVKIAPTTINAIWDCAFCGGAFRGGSVLADLFDEAGEHRGVVCPSCLALGPEGVRARLRLSASAERYHWARAELVMPEPLPWFWEKLPEWWRACFHAPSTSFLAG